MWLSPLSNLEYLNIEFVQYPYGSAFEWLDIVEKFSSLMHLALPSCGPPRYIPPSPSFNTNSTIKIPPITFLDLSGNQLSSEVFSWILKFSSTLVLVNLGSNQLQGSIPEAFGNMEFLQHFDLSYNHLEGRIPSLRNILCLQILDLSTNNLSSPLLDYQELCVGKIVLKVPAVKRVPLPLFYATIISNIIKANSSKKLPDMGS
ncbi:hypothetical protein RJ641_027979 [Dillenia turbinata]|uniref:Uncharacterized protein n=1 Tax=Dillenia turbinata TaxID=194707 RepID=A0AAN8ZM67_9MAGN